MSSPDTPPTQTGAPRRVECEYRFAIEPCTARTDRARELRRLALASKIVERLAEPPVRGTQRGRRSTLRALPFTG